MDLNNHSIVKNVISEINNINYYNNSFTISHNACSNLIGDQKDLRNICESLRNQRITDNHLICPKCYNKCNYGSNWCFYCGELLIGVNFCSGENIYDSSFEKNNGLTSDKLISGSPCFSNYSLPLFVSVQQDMGVPNFIMSSVTLSSYVTTPSTCNNYSMSAPENVNSAHVFNEAMLASNMNESTSAFNSAQCCLSLGRSTENLQCYNNFIDYGNRDFSKTAYSYPEATNFINYDDFVLNETGGTHRSFDGRHRCISGPSQQVKFDSHQYCIPSNSQSNHYPPYDSPSTVLDSINNQQFSECKSCQFLPFRNLDLNMLSNITSFPSYAVNNDTDVRLVRNSSECTFNGTKLFEPSISHCKYISKCSSGLVNNGIEVPGHTFSHNLQNTFVNSEVQLNNMQPQCKWKSSRNARSTQDQALRKKRTTNIKSLFKGDVPKQNELKIIEPKSNSNLSHRSSGQSIEPESADVDKNLKRTRSLTCRTGRRFDSKLTGLANGKPNTERLPRRSHGEITFSTPQSLSKHQTDSLISDSPNWLFLPSELWHAVIRLLSMADRAHLALTCHRLSKLTMDRSLWRTIHLHRQHHLTDVALLRIGNLKPRELRFTYCRGDGLTVAGLERMFLVCGPLLQKLSLIGCTKGPFDHAFSLRLVASHCPNLQHINASYTQAVCDKTVIALAKSTSNLVSVKLNGAQQISNIAIQYLVHHHHNTLERLELFGCFRLNSSIFSLLGRCKELRALAFGHLHHLSSDGLLELVGKLPHLSSLDLRGTQTLGENDTLGQLATKCPYLEEVILANMHSLKREHDIVQMLQKLPHLRVLDLCGLSAVGDISMEALAKTCNQLEQLDVSCTSVTQKGLSHLMNAPASCLRCLRISHCREITKEVLEQLIRACPKLNTLYAYGFITVNDWSFLQKIRSTLTVESGI